jgi:hypothetical protein
MATDVRGTTYLLHFCRPISPNHRAQHYLGFAEDLAARLREHAAGRGAQAVARSPSTGPHRPVRRSRPPRGRGRSRRLVDRGGRGRRERPGGARSGPARNVRVPSV